MSRLLAMRHRKVTHWPTDRSTDVKPHPYPFEDLDRMMRDIDGVLEHDLEEFEDSYFLVRPGEVTSPSDSSPSFGLDTWDF